MGDIGEERREGALLSIYLCPLSLFLSVLSLSLSSAICVCVCARAPTIVGVSVGKERMWRERGTTWTQTQTPLAEREA